MRVRTNFLFRHRMRISFRMLMLLLFICVSTVTWAQTIKVRGTVKDDTGATLPGVSVSIKGTTSGTITDIEGKFSMEVSAGSILVISFIGYTNKEIEVNSTSTDFKIQLQPDMIGLDEVVAIGYGTQKKGDVTSAVATVKADDFLVGKMQDATELIKGKVAGLNITKSSGDPNESSTIRLRGITSIEGDVTPLVLIDGTPGEITDIAPENIESIDVLKDGSSAAIYGTRGANGVILITTKSGRRGEDMKVTYSGYLSTSGFLKKADFMDAQDIRDGLTQYSDGGYETDWLDAVTRNGFTNNHSVSLNGGSEKTTYSGNFSYKQENGTIKKSDNEEYKMQLDLSHYFLNDKVRLHFNLLKALHNNTANTASSDGTSNIYRQAVIHNPTSPIYNEDGSYYEEDRYQYYNPIALLNELDGKTKKEWTHMSGNIEVEPIDNWKTNLMVASHTEEVNTSKYYTSDFKPYSGYNGYASKAYDNTEKKYLDLTSQYDLKINSHHASILGGYSYTNEAYDGFSASNYDFPTDSYSYNSIGNGDALNEGNASMSSYGNDNTLVAFFGRMTYAYKDKYNLLLSLRHEGSSRFGENHKWGNFPSASAGWTITNESFMQNVSWVNHLKLRAGYGVTGREPQDNYLSMYMYDYGSYYMNSDGEWSQALYVTQNQNADLKWERTSEVNLGLDFTLLNSRLSGTIDVYRKKTSDLLYEYSVPVPPNLYTTTMANVGAYTNKGIEITLNATPVKRTDFEWNTTITASHNENKLLNLSNDLYETTDYIDVAYAGDPISVPTHRIEVGKSIGNFWGMKSVDVTEDGMFLIENPDTGEAEEYSSSMSSESSYRQYLGNGLPKVYLGWNNNLKYKSFDLSIQMSSQLGFQILNEQRMFYQNNSIAYNRLKSAADKIYNTAVLSDNQAQTFVSYYLEDGDFLKIDNITLGYNIKINNVSKYLEKARVYVSGQNLFCFTGYSGLDPELSNDDFFSAGNDPRDKYPTIRSFTFGINVTFK